ncbi:glycoside hydrolase family 73 protein [Paenibacillus radicis (ex Xue et al. 2023)]|uniref:Glucosaminidase domain-containing protein n=1 Tax=Paenibacillus radicis (ex Xue et al. 2023) TaxID=2972489 RepID=A0ABT1YMJ1_9BACL|nr:glucosaminidase domain-containing protein [Paenibacillus radicis (ex Xue et al. 2023)]MCR8633508.1 glucosaminidase domain-containing protein [Paenibacillus radicis (ex Xue et al. 2023)]
MKAQNFIDILAPLAVAEQKRTGILASITISQGALESAWGSAAPRNNLFGIKGTGQEFTTQEYINGAFVTVTDGFRVYSNWEGSVIDHSNFLIENSRYTKAGFLDRCSVLDYAGAAQALQAAGYATDPSYATKLISIIENNLLHQYDILEDSKEDETNMPMKLEQWQWDMLYKVMGNAYNADQLNWNWMQKIVDKTLTASELAFLNTVLDGRIDRKIEV